MPKLIINYLRKICFIFCFLLLFMTLSVANAMEVDVAPTMFNNNKKSNSFFGLSTGVSLFSPYRDSGNETPQALGNVNTIFAGYLIKNWIIVVGYEHSLSPINYYGDFNDMDRPGNLMQHPEMFIEVNYYITRKYFWQPYLIYGMSTGWENINGSFVSEGADNHYKFGMGVNFKINDKFNINTNSMLELVKHQALPVETYMKFGLDLSYKISAGLNMVYAITYQTPKLNGRETSMFQNLPIEIDFHGHSTLLFAVGFIFI